MCAYAVDEAEAALSVNRAFRILRQMELGLYA